MEQKEDHRLVTQWLNSVLCPINPYETQQTEVAWGGILHLDSLPLFDSKVHGTILEVSEGQGSFAGKTFL